MKFQPIKDDLKDKNKVCNIVCGCFIVKMVFLLYLSISVTSVDTINLFNQKNKQIFNSNNKNSFSHL